MKQQVKSLQGLRDILPDPSNADSNSHLLNDITTLLYNLVKSTFIIEKQPPQVRLFLIFFSTFGTLLSNFCILTIGNEDQHQVHRHSSSPGWGCPIRYINISMSLTNLMRNAFYSFEFQFTWPLPR